MVTTIIMMTTMMTMVAVAEAITPTDIGTVKLTKATIIVTIAATTTEVTTEIEATGDVMAGSEDGREGVTIVHF